MDLPRNRAPHARPDIRPNDIAIVRLLRLQTSIFQKRLEKIDKNIQNINEKKSSEKSEKRRLALFSMTTNQKQGKYPLCMPKTQTIFIHYELIWCLGCIFTLCSVFIIILRALQGLKAETQTESLSDCAEMVPPSSAQSLRIL